MSQQNQNKQQQLAQQQQQQQQRQQQQWHAHVGPAISVAGTNLHSMFTGGVGGGSTNNIGGPFSGGAALGCDGSFDLEMRAHSVGLGSRAGGVGVVSTPTFDAFFPQNQQQQQQQRRQQQLQQAMYAAHSQPQPQLQLQPPIPSIKMEPLEPQQQQEEPEHDMDILTPTIEMEELIIKTEPNTEDSTYKMNFPHDDNFAFSNYTRHNQQTMTLSMPHTKVEHIKEEPLATLALQKPLNFPRRKMQTERGDTLPICQRCKQVFLKKYSYTKHVAQSSCDIVEYDFKCSICPMSFMSSEELQVHEQVHQAQKYFCHKYCGKYFDTIELCEVHEYMQHDYPAYVCNFCAATYATREQLFSHMPLHKLQQRYDCPVCRVWFQNAHELHQHRLAAPYYCGRYYASKERAASAPHTRTTNTLPTSHLPGTHNQQNYNLQECRMGVMEVPSSSNRHAVSFPNPQCSTASLNNNCFQPPTQLKSEIKIETNDYFYPHEFGQHNFSDFVNDSYANSLPFSNSHHSHSHNNSNSSSSSSREFKDPTLSFNFAAHLPAGSAVHTAATATAQPIIARRSTSSDANDICCVPKCGVRKSTSPSLQFFSFPKDEKYLLQWLHNLKMFQTPPLTYASYRICSLHFPKRCINRYSLCYWAVPTFNLGHDDVANLYQNRELTNTFTTGDLARCSMPGCASQRGESNFKFYNFPNDTKSLIKWCQNARLPVCAKEPRHFCSRHFEERCFGKFRLKPWAVPTLHLGTPYGRIHENPGLFYLEEKKCCLTHCRRARSSDFNLSLYRFPRDEMLLRRWCYNLRLDPSVYRGKNHKICSAHFVKEALGLRKLSPGAVPTLNLGHNDTFNIYENELYQPPPPPPPAPPITHTLSQAASSSAKLYKFHNAGMSALNYAAMSLSPTDFASNMSAASTSNSASTSNAYDSIDVCCVPKCGRNRHTNGVTLHTIPRRLEQLQKWAHNLKMDLERLQHKALRICSAHFETYCIGGCMRPFAVPTLNLGHDDTNLHRNPDVIKKLNIRETCCVPCCKRNRDRDHANLHRFPSNAAMLQKWCDNLQKPVPDGSKLFNDAICEVHFEDRCLRNKRLEKWALPTLNLGLVELMHQLPSEAEVAELWSKPSAPNTGENEGECCVETCKRNPQVDDIKLYRPPEDGEVLAKWAHNLQREAAELTNLRVCSLHFESHCSGKRRLHSWAIPTLNLGKTLEQLYENPEHMLIIKKEKLHKLYDPMKSWAPRCCLSHCRKMRGIDNVQLFRFPHRHSKTLAKWCHNLQMPMVGNMHRRVCSAHFDPQVLTKRCPVPQAVPTLELNTPPGYKLYQNPARLKAKKLRQDVCIIPSCRKARADGVQLFRFPHNNSLRRKWGHNTHTRANEAMRANWRICSTHFEPHSFGVKRLCPGAIPTLQLGHDDESIYPNEAQTLAEQQCIVNGCEASKEVQQVRLFKFPCDDEDQLWKWCNNLKMNPIDCQGVRICYRHFEPECMGPKMLYKWAIPTLQLGHDDAEIELVPIPKPEDRYSELIFKCCVPSCGKTRKFDDAQLNSFPKHIKLFRRWKHNLKLAHLNFREREKYKICNEHFEPICLGKNRLNFGAIPTRNLGHGQTIGMYKVNPAQIQTKLFCTPKLTVGSDDDEVSEDEEEVEQQEQESNTEMAVGNEESNGNADAQAKCCHAACTAPKTLLREPYDMPQQAELLALWQKHIQVAEEEQEPRQLCGLHFMAVYQATLTAANALLACNSALEPELQALQAAYERCANSLLICSAQCCVAGCTSNELGPHKLYQFPRNAETAQQWRFNTGAQVEPTNPSLHKVCALHFEPHCFTDMQRLRPLALPTLELQHDTPSEIYRNPDLNKIDAISLGPATQQCSVRDCGATNTVASPLRLYRFPRDEVLLEKWLHNLQLEREQAPLYRICKAHFQPQCFVGHDSCNLRAWALPTLQLGHNDTTQIHETLVEDVDEQQQSELEDPPTQVKMKTSLDTLKCVVTTCRKSRLQHGVRLFPFPASGTMLRKWCYNLMLPLNIADKQPHICNLHFHKRCIEGKQLRHWAKPTKYLGHSNPIYDNPKNLPGIFLPICCLPHCRKRRTLDNDLRTFGFPKNLTMQEKWCENLRVRPTASQARLCAEHFEPQVLGHRKLRTGAVPTLNLGHNEPLPHDNRVIIESRDTMWQQSDTAAQQQQEEEQSQLHELNDSSADFGDYDKEVYYNEVYGEELAHQAALDLTADSEDDEQPSTAGTANAAEFCDPMSYLECVVEEQAATMPIKKERVINNISPICCLPHCGKQKTPEQHLSTFGFPKDPTVLAKWAANLHLRLEDCIGRVCIDHFELRVVGNRRLKPGAVPTINLGHNDHLPYMNTVDADPKKQQSKQTPFIKLEPQYLSDGCTTPTSATSTPYAEKLNHSVFRLCCLKHCRRKKAAAAATGTPEQHIRTFGFPKAEQLYDKWCENLRLDREYCRGRRVCIDHFEPAVVGKQKLHPGAVPTLDLGPQQPEPLHRNSELTLHYVPSNNNICNVPGCGRAANTDADDGVRLFRFPHDAQLLAQWCDNLQLRHGNCENYKICERHFEPQCVGSTRLMVGAIPTLHLPHGGRMAPKHVTNPLSIMRSRVCCIAACRKASKQPPTSLFLFPKSSQLLARKWYHNTQQKLQQHAPRPRICAAHFEPHALLANGRPRPWAVPTLKLGHADAIFQNPHKLLKELQREKCCLPNCQASEFVPLYSYPQRGALLRQWAHNTQQDAYLAQRRNYKVCRRHFDSGCFADDGSLKSGAVPTLELGRDVGDIYTPEPETTEQTHSQCCSIRKCGRSVRIDGVKLFPFPLQNPELLHRWCHNLHLSAADCSQHQICNLHFEAGCLHKRQLHEWAVPTLLLGRGAAEQPTQLYRNPELEQLKPLPSSAYCCVPGCGKCRQMDGVRMYSFPKQRPLYLRWTHNLKLQPTARLLSAYKVCHEHFEEYCNGPMHLRQGAVPTQRLGHADDNIYRNNRAQLTESGKLEVEVQPPPTLQCVVPQCQLAQLLRMPLYSLPAEASLRQRWCEQLKLTDPPTTAKLCALHFRQTYNECNARDNDENQNVQTPAAVAPDKHLCSDYAAVCRTTRLLAYQCSVPGCDTNATNAELRLYKFPASAALFDKWQQNTHVQLDAKFRRRGWYKVCALHFESRCFGKAQRLYSWALPTLQLQHTTEHAIHMLPLDVEQHQQEDSAAKINARVCCIASCRQQRDRDAGIRLYAFPTSNVSLFQQWLHNVRLEEAHCRRARICTLHFEQRCVGKRLHKRAVPTLDLGHSEEHIYHNKRLKKKRLARCLLAHCRKTPRLQRVQLHALPKLEAQLQQWQHNLHLPATAKKGKICSAHFEACCYDDARRLKKWALPTLDLGHDGAVLENRTAAMKEEEAAAEVAKSIKVKAEFNKAAAVEAVEVKDTLKAITASSAAIEHCAIPSCSRTSATADCQLYAFPKTAWLRQSWCDNTHLPFAEAAQLKICDAHFEPNVKGSMNLRLWSRPTLLLGHNDAIHDNPKLPCTVTSKYVRRNSCAIVSCGKSKADGVQLFQYPKKSALLRKWAKNCKHSVSQAIRDKFRICSEHFEAYCYEHGQLKCGSIPTLQLGHDDGDIFTMQRELLSDVLGDEESSELKCCQPQCAEVSNVKQLYELPQATVLRAAWLASIGLQGTVEKQAAVEEQQHAPKNNGTAAAEETKNVDSNKSTEICYFETATEIKIARQSKMEDHGSEAENAQLAREDEMDDPKTTADTTLAKQAKLPEIKTAAEFSISPEFDAELAEDVKLLRHGEAQDASAAEESKTSQDDVAKIAKDVTFLEEVGISDNKPTEKSQRENEANDDFKATEDSMDEEALECSEAAETELEEDGKQKEDAALRLCAVHFKVSYDKNASLLEQLLASAETDTDLRASLQKLQSQHAAVCNTTRVRSLSCAVVGCRTRVLQHEPIKLYSLPCNRELLQKWLHNTQAAVCEERSSYMKVCELHFESNCFGESISKRLKYWAVPTLQLPPPRDDDTEAPFSNPAIEQQERHMLERKCCIAACKHARTQVEPHDVQLYSFPKNTELLQKWLHNTQLSRREAFSARICALHFEKHCINKRMRYWALPTLLLGHDNPNIYLNPGTGASAAGTDTGAADNVPASSTNNEPLEEESNDMELLDPMSIKIKLEVESDDEVHEKQQQVDELEEEEEEEQQDEMEKEEQYDSRPSRQPHTSRHCQIVGCRGHADQPGITLHKFPIPEELFRKWLHNTQINVVREIRWKYRICSRHFEAACFRGRRLQPGTMPTLLLGPKQPTTIYENEFASEGSSRADEDTHTSPNGDGDCASYDEYEPARLVMASYDSNSKEPPEQDKPLEIKLEVQHVEEFKEHFEAAVDYAHSQLHAPQRVNKKTSCAILGCTSDAAHVGITLHKFPMSEEQCRKWEYNTSIDVDRNSRWKYKICSRHFQANCFRGKRLLTGTMPTLHLGASRPAELYEDEFYRNDVQSAPLDETCQEPPIDALQVVKNEVLDDETSDPDDMTPLSSYLDVTLAEQQLQPQTQLEAALKKKYMQEFDQNMSADADLSYDAAPEESLSLSLQSNTRHCRVVGCNSHLGQLGVKMHKFPLPEELFQKWMHNTQVKVDRSCRWKYKVCGRHFEPGCLRGRRFYTGTMPTLHLGPNRPAKIYRNEFVLFKAKSDNALEHSHELSAELDVSVLSAGDDDDDSYYAPEAEAVYEDSVPALTHFMDPSGSAVLAEESNSHLDSVSDLYQPDLDLELQLTAVPDFEEQLDVTERPHLSANKKRICSLVGCNVHVDQEPGIRLHKFPVAPEHFSKWVHNTQLDVDREMRWKYKLCNRHFEPECFRGIRLHPGSMPTLHLGPNSPAFIYENSFTRRQVQLPGWQMPSVERSCCIPNCEGSSAMLYDFPKCKQLLAKWLPHLNIEYDAARHWAYQICARHFKAHCFEGEQLRENAVPTLNCGATTKAEKSLRSANAGLPLSPSKAASEDFVYNDIKSGYQKCSLIHCQKQVAKDNVKTYKFPKSAEQQQQWSHNLRIQYDPQRPWKYLICSAHFEAQCVDEQQEGKTQLQPWAVPTLNLGDNVPAIRYTNEKTRALYQAQTEAGSDQEEEAEIELETEAETEQSQGEPAAKHMRMDFGEGTPDFHWLEDSLSHDAVDKPTKQKSFGDVKSVKKCSLAHCQLERGAGGCKLFRFPTDAETLKKWKHNLRKKFNAHQRNVQRVCSMHFEPHLIGVKRLLKGSVPTRNLGHCDKNIYDNPKSIIQTATGVAASSVDQLVCDVPGCGRIEASEGGVRFFQFPEAQRYTCIWQRRLQIDYEPARRDDIHVCDAHFNPQFISHNGLDTNAVPTLNLPPERFQVCAVPGCGNSGLEMYSLPKHDDFRRTWLKRLQIAACDAQELRNMQVCAAHFEQSYFRGLRLNSKALPTLRLPQEQLIAESPTVHLVEQQQQQPDVTSAYCSAPHCINNAATMCSSKLYRFPEKRNLYVKWCHNLQLDYEAMTHRNSQYAICPKHFEPHSLRHGKLHPEAVPTLHLGHADPNIFQNTASFVTQTATHRHTTGALGYDEHSILRSSLSSLNTSGTLQAHTKRQLEDDEGNDASYADFAPQSSTFMASDLDESMQLSPTAPQQQRRLPP